MTASVEFSNTRLPNVAPYNTFTLTCTASAPEGVVTPKTFTWSLGCCSDEGSCTNGLTVVTGSVDNDLSMPVSTSILTVTESSPGDYCYRCKVEIGDISVVEVDDVFINIVGKLIQHCIKAYISVTSDSVSFAGPSRPTQPVNITHTDITDKSATIQWIVPIIAFTPESYTVHYGTSNNCNIQEMVSTPVESGSDFLTEDQTFSIELTGLSDGTTYYYQLNATNTNGSTVSDVYEFMTTVASKLF